MRRLIGGSLVAGLFVALAILGLRVLPSDNAEAVFGVADSAPGVVDTVAIDMDGTVPAANPDNGLIPTPLDTCRAVAVGSTIDIDIVIDEVDAADLLKGYETNLSFTDGASPGAVKVTAVNDTIMTAALGDPQLPLSDIIPVGGDLVSPFKAAATSLGVAHESGEGVLARITIEGVVDGLGTLGLSGSIPVAASNAGIPVTNEVGALVAVGTASCPIPSDLKIVSQVHTASPTGDVSVDENFQVIKEIHNNGPNPAVVADLTSTGIAPANCTLSYHATDSEIVTIPAGVSWSLNGVPQGVGPATVPLAPSDVVVAAQIIVKQTLPPIPVSVPTNVIEDWDKHCTEPSFHQFTISNEITQNDPNENELQPADNTAVSVIDEEIFAQSDVKVVGLAITSVIPPGITSEDGFNDDGDPLTREGATVLQIDIDKTLHNNGPYGPTTVAILDAGTAIIPTGLPGPAGAVPANCTITKIAGPASAVLPVSVPVVVQESYELYCGLSPFQNVNDDFPADLDFDEDPVNGLDEDGDTNADEDPSFEVAAFQIINQIGPIDPHIIDPDLLNNGNGTGGSVPAFLPSNPSFSAVIDTGAVASDVGHTFPIVVGTPPVSKDCLIISGCEQMFTLNQPGGNILHGAITFVPQPAFSIANGLTDLLGAPVVNGTLVADTTFAIRIDLGGGCNVPIGGGLTLTDGALPLAGAWAGSTVGPEGPDDATAPALANPFVWPSRLEGDLQSNGLILAGGILWARYVGFEPATGTPINILVFNLGAGGYAHVAILGDPTTPSGLINCTPFDSETDYLGETVAGTANLRVCNVIGSHTFTNQWTRSDNGATSFSFDVNTCSAENDVSVTKSDDQNIGDDNPSPDDRIHVSIPTQRDIDIVVTNGQVPADVDVSVSLVFTGTTSPPECDVSIVNPAGGSTATIGNQSLADVSFEEAGMAPFEVRNVTVTYEIHCSSPVTLTDALQVVVNASSTRPGSNDALPDPNLDNNQAENVISVHSEDDYDGDTVPTPTDNCPDVPNPDQTDTDGDGIGDACDPDDDDDGIDDGNDGCPLIAEDGDGIDDLDGCPDTDASVSVTKDEVYTVDSSTTVTKTVDITISNGNYPADLLSHALAVSTIGECEVHMVPEPGDSLVEFTTDEDGNTVDDTLWSQLEWTESGMAAGESRNMTRDYTIHCFQRSSHTFELQVDTVPLPPVEEEDVDTLPNVHKNYPDVTVLDHADLKKVSISASAPASADAGVPFNITVTQTVHNNGPVVANGQDEVVINLPQDCTSTFGSEIQQFPNMAVSSPITYDTVFTVTCSTPSTHTISFDDTISVVNTLHVTDDNPANDTGATSVDVDILGNADLKVSSVVINGPLDIDVSTDNAVTVTATVHNNGPEPVTNATVNISASVSPDCTLVPSGTSQNVALPVSVPTDVVLNAVLHCTQPSNHNINADADVSFNQLHVSDPDGANNNLSAAQHDLEVWATADLKISSDVAQDDLPTAGQQIVIVPPGPITVQLDETIHNNGSFGPAAVVVNRSAAGSETDDQSTNGIDDDGDTIIDNEPNIPECSATALTASSNANLSVSVGQLISTDIQISWDDVKKPPYSCDVTIDQSIAGPGGHIVDPDGSNDADTVTLTLVRDTDGDGVVDNFDGTRDNCQDVPNPGQEDADGDGLGDACDPNPARDAGIQCDILLGPAAINLSDFNGRYGWVVCVVTNNDSHEQRVTVNANLSTPPAGCTQDDVLIIPGLSTFVLLGGEEKTIVERVRVECHLPGDGPGVYDLLITKCITSEKVNSDDDGDTLTDEDPIDGIDNDGDSLIDEDPPEGNDVDPSNDCSSIGKPVVIETP